MSHPRHHWSGPPTSSTVDRHGIGVLDESTCFRLLGEESVGRLGFSAQALPVIFPVNFLLDGRTIYFSSEPGDKVRAAHEGSVACFEIDWFDALSHDGWSVLATGRLGVIDGERAIGLENSRLAHWAFDGSRQLLELPIELMSGRRIRQA